MEKDTKLDILKFLHKSKEYEPIFQTENSSINYIGFEFLYHKTSWGYWSEQCVSSWEIFPSLNKLKQHDIGDFIFKADKHHVAAVLYALHSEFYVSSANIDKAIMILENEKIVCTDNKRKWAIDYEINELVGAKKNKGFGISTSILNPKDVGELGYLKIINPTPDQIIDMINRNSIFIDFESENLNEAIIELKDSWSKIRGYQKLLYLLKIKFPMILLEQFVINNPYDCSDSNNKKILEISSRKMNSIEKVPNI